VWAVPYDFVGACDAAPEICLGVPYFNWGPAYLDAAMKVLAGTYEQTWDWNAPYWDDLTDNTQTSAGWINGPALSGDASANLAEFIGGLASGSINMWSGPLNLQDGSPYISDGATATDNEIWYLPQLLEGMTGPSN
ncbi:MAG: BMP family ABC transporter substrate-binding protein, partial [Chloroflexota bacterium]